MSRTTALVGTAIAAVVAGAALYVTAPPTSLVDAPAYPQSEALTADLDSTVTPKMTSFYDPGQWTPARRGP